ncbi:MAG: DUF1566 domain-containing protein, partial [Gammaproteobacteria bacterium]|nr:DUF1566 domain-containing protein [Gammaproteobacteria bacterium]
AGGAGSVLTILESDGYDDGELGDNEYVDVHFNICLAAWAPFSFYVDNVGLTIGDEGPASGIVFYIEDTGVNGLEAALEDQSTGAEWGCYGTEIAGADGTAVGTGASNTADILAGCNEPGIAAELCDDYSVNGYDDWFLPSKDELARLYAQGEVVLGVQGPGGYDWRWSSTDVPVRDTSELAWSTDGFAYIWWPKDSLLRVRAVRAF